MPTIRDSIVRQRRKNTDNAADEGGGQFSTTGQRSKNNWIGKPVQSYFIGVRFSALGGHHFHHTTALFFTAILRIVEAHEQSGRTVRRRQSRPHSATIEREQRGRYMLTAA